MALTRNQKYEKAKRDKGFTKVTLWIPEQVTAEMRQMAEFLCETKSDDLHIPYMARSLKTGRMKRAVD